MKLNLGIIKSNNNNEIINHRSLFKIIVNPFLRYFFGKFLVTKAYNNKIGFYEIRETEIKKSLKEELKRSWIYQLNGNQTIEFKRWLI